VRKEYRRLSLAKKLLNEVLQFAISNNYKFITLSTLDFMKPAIKLYEASGFKLEKSEQLNKKASDGSTVTVVYYKKLL
jgi:ribosomal protein S18 acetylase RimI-like enzyme